jgi:RNA polymerase sigma factor (sigma-70 family)
MSPQSEKILIDRVLNSDRQALDELLLLRFEWLLSVVGKMIPKSLREDVEPGDVLQEAFVRILKGFSGFSPSSGEAGLFSWLKTIAENTARDMLRNSARKVGVASSKVEARRWDDSVNDVVDFLAISNDNRVSVSACRLELRQACQIAIANLEPKYRNVIVGLYFDNLSLDEVASKLELSTASVRGIRQRAREKIRDQIARLSHFL